MAAMLAITIVITIGAVTHLIDKETVLTGIIIIAGLAGYVFRAQNGGNGNGRSGGI